MEIVFRYVVVIVLSYLFGSFNFAIIVSRYIKNDDVRTKGSGNAGITNYIRNFGGLSPILVGAGDIAKCVIATKLSSYIFAGAGDPYLGVLLSGLFVMLGHMFPLYFGFKGGKGVLTMAALIFIFDWRVFAICISVFILLVIFTRYVSLGSVVAVGLVPFFIFFFHGTHPLYFILTALTSGIVIFMHRANIKRLLSGTESKFTWKRDT